MKDLWEKSLHQEEAPDWNFKSLIPQIVVINLGTNDFALSIPDSAQFVDAYLQFIQKIKGR